MNSVRPPARPAAARAGATALLVTALALAPGISNAQNNSTTIEDLIAHMLASAEACKGTMPKEVARGLDDLRARFQGLDIAVIEQTQAYQKAHQEEVASLRALSAKDLRSGCEWNWGSFREGKAKQLTHQEKAKTPEARVGAAYASAAVCEAFEPEQASKAREAWEAEYARMGGNVRVSQQSETFRRSYDSMTRKLQDHDEKTLRSECARLLRY